MTHPFRNGARLAAALMLSVSVLSLLPVQAQATKAALAQAVGAPAVTFVSAAAGPIAEKVVATGTLVARDEVLVAPQIDGHRIEELLVDVGDRVKAGDVVARLSRERLEIELSQMQAALAKAEASVAQSEAQVAEAEAEEARTRANLVRAKELRGSGVIAAEAFDDRQAAARAAAARAASAREGLKVARAGVALARAQLDDTGLKLERTEIRAPVDGLVSRRTAKQGALASMAGEPLFRIVADGVVELEASVPEALLARLTTGQSAEVRPAGAPAPVAGTVRLVSPEVDGKTRLGTVRIALDASEGLAVGAFSRVEIEVARSAGLLVPLSAVMWSEEGPRVQVIVNGVVETRRVVVGLKADGKVEIVSGLKAGEAVVAVAGSFVRDGDRVNPVPAGY